ncbi:hypothetical protein BT93_L5135 [Corymbia citriodora subsp. variegata]|uniref:Uncharacterized protein n=1 Tax=Corymbia citriodora subsp. variegata TaxID=360336 RepID=A0A8T0CX93_CORYI|nr:hypothetical protein BT93_L5135 [Corymbia citriodora subsp. variegata]
MLPQQSLDEEIARSERATMWYDIILQAGIMLVAVFMFLAMHNIPQKALSKLRFRGRKNLQAKQHFVRGAQLLGQARSAPSRSAASSLAKDAAAEADKAILLDPRDAASHILKALALDLQGFKTSALDSLDVALSPLAAKSLSDPERGDALFRRAQLKFALNRRGRVDSAIEDLTQAVKLSCGAKALLLLGQCYEAKKSKEEAAKAYKEALEIEPTLTAAQEALDRLCNCSSVHKVMDHSLRSQQYGI